MSLIKKVIYHLRSRHIIKPIFYYFLFCFCDRLRMLPFFSEIENDSFQENLRRYKLLTGDSFGKNSVYVFSDHKGLPSYIYIYKKGARNQPLYATVSRTISNSYYVQRCYGENDSQLNVVSSIDVTQTVHGHNVHPENFISRSYQSKLHTYRLQDVLIMDNFMLHQKNNILILDEHNDPADSTSGYGNLVADVFCYDTRDYLSFYKKRREYEESYPIELKEGYLLTSKYSKNFFHFIYEDIVKIKDIDNFLSDDMPIYVPDDLYPQQYEVLSFLLEKRDIRLISKKKKYKASSLIYSQIPSYVSDNIHVEGHERFRISSEHLLYLRDKINKSAVYSDKKFPKRIYISRKGRSVLNFYLLRPVLKRYKIKIVDTGKMSFADQYTLFAHAELVIGAAGAGLTSILFCKPGTKIIVLNSQRHAENCVFSTIAKILDLDYRMLLGPPLYKKGKLMDFIGGEMVSFLSPFFISPKKLKDALSRVL